MASPGGVVINFIAKADQAAREVANFSKKLVGVDDAADKADSSLSSVQREIDQTGDKARTSATDTGKMETALDEVGDEAEQTARRLRQSASEMASGIRTGATNIDTETGHIKQSLGEAGRESGAEFIGNVAEGIGSGSASVTDVVQGTLGGLTNLAASLGGPVGIAAGVAATGIGLVFSAVKAEAVRTKQTIDDMVAALIEVGDTASQAARDAQWSAWLADAQKIDGKIANIANGLRGANVPMGTFEEAMTGNVAAAREIDKNMKATADKIAEQVRQGKPLTAEQQKWLENSQDVRDELKKSGVSLDQAETTLRDIELLTGDNKKAASDWAAEQERVYDAAHKTKNEIESIDQSDIEVVVSLVGKDGMPFRPDKVIPGMATMSVPVAGVAGRAAPPTVVNVYANTSSIPNSPRALIRMLEDTTVRMGRKAGTPRRTAW